MELKGVQLADILNREIDNMTDENTSRSDVISQMARAAGISSSTVNQILTASINCPPLSRLSGFSDVLGVSQQSLRSAAESDGCEYIETSGLSVHPSLATFDKSINLKLRKIRDKYSQE